MAETVVVEDTKQDETGVDSETLEKSWNASRDDLRGLLDADFDHQIELLEKANKAQDEDDEDDDDEYEYEDEDDEEMEQSQKSIEDFVTADVEAEAAMDVEPFLRRLVKGIDRRFKVLEKSIAEVHTLAKSHARVSLAAQEMQKSISETVEAIGGQTQPSGSVLRKSAPRFEDSALKGMAGSTIMRKALAASQQGRIDSMTLSKIEGRMNKGLALEGPWEKAIQEVTE